MQPSTLNMKMCSFLHFLIIKLFWPSSVIFQTRFTRNFTFVTILFNVIKTFKNVQTCTINAIASVTLTTSTSETAYWWVKAISMRRTIVSILSTSCLTFINIWNRATCIRLDETKLKMENSLITLTLTLKWGANTKPSLS